jgi:hypothetical protein
LLLKWVTEISSSETQQWDLILQAFVIALTVLWLFAKQISKFTGFVRFFLSLSIFAVIAGIGVLSHYIGFLKEAVILFVLPFSSGFILLMSMAVAGGLCKRQYRPKRFMIWLGLLSLLCGIFVVYVLFTIMILITSKSYPSGSEFFEVLLYGFFAGLILGLCIYVINALFMILPFGDPFFRERFLSCLRIKSISAPIRNSTIDKDTSRDSIQEGSNGSSSM